MERGPDIAGEPFQEPDGHFREPAAEFREPDEHFGEPAEDFPEPDGHFREPAEESYEPEGESRPGSERRPVTGEPRVDAALARLDELAGRPVTEHRAIFEDVHGRLREVLGELDTRQPPPAQGAAGPVSRPGR
jgi:hypothetical protein